MDKSPIRILLVDDDEDYFFLTRSLFHDVQRVKFDVEWVSTYEEALEAIGRSAHDVYLLDYNLGAHNGLELLREAIANGCKAPLIMLTGQGDDAVDIAAMNAGAADYLVKGRVDAQVLDRSIRYAMERAKTLEAFRESEERYALAVRGAKDGVWDWNLKTNRVYFSGRWRAILGEEEEEMSASPDEWFHRVHPEDLERVQTQMDAHLEGITAYFECEFRMRYHDGSYRWMLGRGTAFRDGEGRACRMAGTISQCRNRAETILTKASRLVGTLTDISDRKQAEAALRQIEEQLRQAQKVESIGCLAGGVAHDFNNLLTAITGYCEHLLHQIAEGDPIRSEIQEVHKAGMRAAALTKQLLAFSRRQILQPKVLNLNAVVAETEKMLRRLIDNNIELVTELDSELGAVKIDPTQIEQILINLAVNARDAMEKGGTITIRTANVHLDEEYARTHPNVVPGPHVALSVQDTGSGMTEEVQARLFEPFFTTKEQGKGTGLGLSTVYGIVRQSAGDICVQSVPNRGTTFTIYLRRVENTPESFPSPESQGSLLRGTETVLVVEDEDVVREMVSMSLREQGYTVWTAANGEEGLAFIERRQDQKPDLVFTDVLMPKMGGKELADRIKIVLPKTKVIFASGYTKNSFGHNRTLDPSIAFLPKPFSLVGLSHKVREVLDAPAQPVEAADLLGVAQNTPGESDGRDWAA